jgi:hypothetical protein
MKLLRPPFSRVADGAVQCFCSTCDAYLPRTAFHAGKLKRKARCCKKCHSRKQQRRRASSAVARMLYALKNRIHALGHHELARAWEAADVEAALLRGGHRKPWPAKLTLVAVDPAAPLRPANTRAMPTRLARGRHHRRRRGIAAESTDK